MNGKYEVVSFKSQRVNGTIECTHIQVRWVYRNGNERMLIYLDDLTGIYNISDETFTFDEDYSAQIVRVYEEEALEVLTQYMSAFFCR